MDARGGLEGLWRGGGWVACVTISCTAPVSRPEANAELASPRRSRPRELVGIETLLTKPF